MRILVTNDDGIYSPGLAALARAAANFGEVKIVAPDVEQSSMSHAITATRPLSYRSSPVDFDGIEAYRVNGTPSDCVALGTHLWSTTDLVVSGINLGYNLGNQLWHSGTLAAAKQAVLLGVRGIAFSTTVDQGEPNYPVIEKYIAECFHVLESEKDIRLININLPRNPAGIEWTNQSVRQYDARIVPGVDPMGRKLYWYNFIPLEAAEEGTDRWAVDHNLVSVTPLRLELTDNARLKELRKKVPL